MTLIYCADSSCAHQGDDGVCNADSIRMSWNSIMTLHDGRQTFLKCKNYEESDEYKVAKRIFAKILEDEE